MCGIIGKIGVDNVAPDLIKGLKSLEYRGYDSAGVALICGNKIGRCRTSGRISALEKELSNKNPCGIVGVGHTRWATHGSPTKENAHPHLSPKGVFALVHNGIIENAENIKKDILPRDSLFSSQTDTEVVTHLLEKYYKEDPVRAISNTCRCLNGSYAFGILCEDFPEKLFAAANLSPLIVAECETGNYIASDIIAIKDKIKNVYGVYDGEICEVTLDSIKFYNCDGKEIKKLPEKLVAENSDAEKDGYEHFMLKEIMQQPEAVKNTIDSLLKDGKIILPNVKIQDSFWKKDLEKIVIVACGSAYHTGLVAKFVIEGICNIPCSVEIASEFRYSVPFVNEKTLALFVSQSGETADTLAALRLSKKRGAKVLSIVNVAGSTMARESDNVILTKAGREIAVATTKAYSAQLVALYALGIFVSEKRGTITADKEKSLITELKKLPVKIGETLEKVNESVKSVAREIFNGQDVFYIGRLSDYATACEGSLKLKEISYINSQVYAAGELKHGTISLINQGTLVVAVASQRNVFSKTLSNIAEVEARGAKVICVTDEKMSENISEEYEKIVVADTIEEFKSSLLVIPLQLLSYYTAKLKGCDIDKPKNLAKSVTVE